MKVSRIDHPEKKHMVEIEPAAFEQFLAALKDD